MKKEKIIKVKVQKDYPFVGISDKERKKEELLKKLNLYKIRPGPEWIYSAVGIFYVLAENREDAERIANNYLDDTQLFGSEATWELIITKTRVSKDVIKKLLDSERYEYNRRELVCEFDWT